MAINVSKSWLGELFTYKRNNTFDSYHLINKNNLELGNIILRWTLYLYYMLFTTTSNFEILCCTVVNLKEAFDYTCIWLVGLRAKCKQYNINGKNVKI